MMLSSKAKLLTMEYRENGTRSPIISQSPRELFNMISRHVSLFEATNNNEDVALAPNSLQAPRVHMRDLRKLQMPFSNQNQPCVICRHLSILLNFDPFRTIVLHDRVIVLVPDGADGILDKLQELLVQQDYVAGEPSAGDASEQAATQTFPFRAVEAVMATVLSNLDKDLSELSKRTGEGLRQLEDRKAVVTIEALENMRKLKNMVASQEARAINARRAISDVLDDDEDMALMNFVQPVPRTPSAEALSSLTQLPEPLAGGSSGAPSLNPLSEATSSSRWVRMASVRMEDHSVFEILFEGNLQTVSTIQTSLEVLRAEIANGENFHYMRLTIARNRLLSIEISLTVLTACTTLGTFISGLYGMNLNNGFNGDEERSRGMFTRVTVGTASGVVALSLLLLWVMSRSFGFGFASSDF